jgi:thiopeptide-type bacteriocin biosynthesis protein
MYKWFFIRYTDAGGYHIRLRMKVKDQYIGDILNAFRRNMDDSLKCGVIHNYQADIYFPELERYGPQTMSETEDAFFTSSKLIAAFVERNRQFPEQYLDYQLALISVYYMSALAYPDKNEQEHFLKTMANQFYIEFSTNKSLRIELDTKYREMKDDILYTLSDPNHILQAELGEYFREMLASLKTLIDKVTAINHDRKAQLLADLIHMHLNRTFKHKQRKQEMVTYYLANKFCNSQIAQLAKKNKLKQYQKLPEVTYYEI